MNIFRNTKKIVIFLRENGFHDFLFAIISNLGNRFFHLDPKTKWNSGIKSEVRYWDSYIKTKGLERPEIYEHKFDPDLALQPRPALCCSPKMKSISWMSVLDH